MVLDKFVNYDEWHYQNDVRTTLGNVFTPLDMKVKEKIKFKNSAITNITAWRSKNIT